MSRCLHCLVLILALSGHSLAVGQGFYAGLELGLSSVDDFAETVPSPQFLANEQPFPGFTLDGVHFDGTDETLSAALGYEVNSWFAVEASYSDLGKTKDALAGSVGLSADEGSVSE